MNKILIANGIGIITFILGIIANFEINRRKNTVWWLIINIIDGVSYLLLGSVQVFMACLYAGVRFCIILLLHKKEKIIQGKLEAIILSLPYLLIGFLNWKEGTLAIVGGICNFINAMLFIVKKDEDRIKYDFGLDIYYLFYDLMYKNYVSAGKDVVEMVQWVINIYRLQKNGESKYYKDKMNVIKENNERYNEIL